MRVALINYGHLDRQHRPEQVLDEFETLTGWAESLHAAGAEVTVVQGFRSDHSIERAGVQYRFVAGSFAPQLSRWRIPFRLHGLVRDLDPSVVHLNGLMFDRQAWDVRRQLGDDTVIVAQHHAEQPSRGLSGVVQRKGLRVVDGFFFTGREMAAPWYRRGLIHPRQKLYEIAEGSTGFRLVDRSEARRATGLRGNPICLWIGNLTANKDPATILDGFARFRQHRPEAHLYMAYRRKDLLAEVKRRIESDRDLNAAVTLLGTVPHDELELFFNSADFFLQGSHYEGSGYGLIEALACGVVPVVTDIPSFRFITGHGRIGRLWSVGESDSLTAALLRGPASQEQRLEIRRHFDQHLSYSAIADQSIAAYHELRGRSVSLATRPRESEQPFGEFLCPACRELLDSGSWKCSCGHQYEVRNGVLELVAAELKPRLRGFLETVRQDRERQGRRILANDRYDGLPWAEDHDFEWRFRCNDLEVLHPLIRDRPRPTVLDIGSYNGWLARNLADSGCVVTGLDYFDDPYDGLAARRWYTRANWCSVQLDLRDLTVVDQTFDVVVLNRCLQFFPDPRASLRQAKEKVSPGGLLIVTGLDLYRDPRRKTGQIEAQRAHYRARYGVDFFLNPTRGLLDFEDRRWLTTEGLRIREYRQLWRRNVLSRLLPSRPRLCFGVWFAPGASPAGSTE